MALYENLSASSSPEDIAAAYKEFAGLAGGDTAAVQQQAVDYLSALGVAAPAITQAYSIYTAPPVTSTGGLSSVTSGKNTVLEDTSTFNNGSTGALTQATGGTGSTTGSTTGALDQVTSTVGSKTASPFDAINQAFIGGDYAGTAGIIASAGLTADQIKAYYGFGDDTMNFLKGQGIFGTFTPTPTSLVATPTPTSIVTTPTPINQRLQRWICFGRLNNTSHISKVTRHGRSCGGWVDCF